MRTTWQSLWAVTFVLVIASCAQHEPKSESHRHLASIPADKRPVLPPLVLRPPREAKATGTALVQFHPDVPPAEISKRIEEAGAKVVRLVPSVNGALITSDKRDLPEPLIQKLGGLKGLRGIMPLTYFQSHQAAQWDNTLLSAVESVAYTSVRMPEAATYVAGISSYHPTDVAIIDSGLNRSFGQQMEFANVRYYDLCTPQGLAGQPATTADSRYGHGTMMAGIVAGANNGAGNNGMITHLPFSWAAARIYGTQCDDNGMRGDLIIHAMEHILQSSRHRIVLMPFGLGSDDDAGKQWLTRFFEPFFRAPNGETKLWVASAGNNDRSSNCDGFLMFPAGMACRLPNVVSVGGFDPSTRTRAALSNHGDLISINAPGANVHTAVGPGSYGAATNTSGAAAMVAGAAALFAGTRRVYASQIKFALQASAQGLPDTQLWRGGLDVGALLALPPPASLAGTTLTGSSSGGQRLQAQPFANSGLAGFHLNYSSEDHLVKKIAAGFMPQVPGATPQVIVDLSDDNADDNYSWVVDAQQLPPGTTFHEVSSTVSIGISRPLLPPEAVGVPVLTAFSFNFHNDDHHLKTIQVQLRRDQFNQVSLTIGLEDDTPGKTYTYKVAYALVPPDRVFGVAELSGSTRGSLNRFLPANLPVLQGFRLSFISADHHIDEIAVRLLPGDLHIRYNDKNNDDNFTWNIWWADLRTQ